MMIRYSGMETQHQLPQVDISMRWQHMPQTELYRETNEPDPSAALLKADTEKFHLNSAAYAFSNEPAKTLEDIMDYNDKRGIGVAASGDQAFVFFKNGLREYLGFDISQVACFWVELKSAAKLNLTRTEFLGFATGNGSRKSSCMDSLFGRSKQAVYDRLRGHLTPYSQLFFDNVIKDRDCIRDLLYDHRFFRGGNGGFSEGNVPYVQSDAAYELTSRNMRNSPFKVVWSGIDEAMLLTPQETYDLIFVSNILDRWGQFGNSFTRTLDLMKKRLSLTSEARIIGNYQLGYGVAADIRAAADEVGLKFTEHCRDAPDYWTLQH